LACGVPFENDPDELVTEGDSDIWPCTVIILCAGELANAGEFLSEPGADAPPFDNESIVRRFSRSATLAFWDMSRATRVRRNRAW